MTDAETMLQDQTVLIGDGRIVQMGPRTAVPAPRHADRIDGSGKYLMPGLTDMHVHLEILEDPDILQLFVSYGVTTVRNMDGRPFVADWRTRVASGDLVGPRIVTAGPIIDGSPPLRADNLAVSDVDEARREVRRQHETGYDFIKVYTNLSPQVFEAISEAAVELGMPIVGHIPRGVEVGEGIAAMGSVEHLVDYGRLIASRGSGQPTGWHWSNLLLAQPIDEAATATLAGELARLETWTTPTLIEAERRVGTAEMVETWRRLSEMSSVPDSAMEYWLEQAEASRARLKESDWALIERGRRNRLLVTGLLERHGARLLAGTDTPNLFVVPGASLHDELELLVLAGLTPGEALMSATGNPALFLGRQEEGGSVKPGHRADLILLDANPLTDIRNTRRIIAVSLDGRWISGGELSRMRAALNGSS